MNQVLESQIQQPTTGPGPARSKEIRIVLPLRFLVNLHALKLLKSQSIRESVTRALEDYFSVHPVAAAFPTLDN